MKPKKVRADTNPSREKICMLLKFADARCERTGPFYDVLLPLATTSPVQRLTANLYRMLQLTEINEVRDILADGLTGVERQALLELELHGASDELLSIAHGLLNVHERWFLLKSVGRKYRDAAVNRGEFARPSDVLGTLLEDRVDEEGE